MVIALNIEFGEDCCSGQSIQQVINLWNWKSKFDGDMVDHSTIDAHPVVAITLGDEDGWHNTRAQA